MIRLLSGALVLAILIATPVAGQKGLKVYISADMEGVAGTVTSDQLGPAGFEYQRFPEIMTAEVNAAIAGHFGVPVVMLSGDDAIAEEATGLLGDLETAVTKWSISFHSARTLMPEASYALIGQKVAAALGRLSDFRPYKLQGPVSVDISFKNYTPAELLAYLPDVDRVDSHTVRFVGKDMVEVSKFLEVATGYQADILR